MKSYLKNLKYLRINKLYYGFKKKMGQLYPSLNNDDIDSILVIAPHPDDDVIGCGGVLAKYKNKKIRVVFITNGGSGDTTLTKEEIINKRRNEAMSSLETIGIKEIIFLDTEDGKVRENIEKVSELLKPILEGWENIFIPSFLDNHDDHKAATEAVYRALKKIGEFNGNIWFYEVWSTHIPNVLVDITNYMDIKKKLIEKHKSQIENIDYFEKIAGLNAYRSIAIANKNNKDIRYCEGFYKCDLNTFNNIMRKFV